MSNADSPSAPLTDEQWKSQMKSYWEGETCGIRYATSSDRKEYFDEIQRVRYRLEPQIPKFAGFAESRGKRVLEIGVGAGTDFHNWIRNGAIPTGVDLTEAAIRLTRERMDVNGVDPKSYELRQADAESLPFPDASFDIVYSYGVLQHTPHPEKAFAETFRLLKPGGSLRVMVYHVPSWTGLMFWTHYCLLRGRPWRSAKDAIFHHMQGGCVKAYTRREGRALLADAGYVDIQSEMFLSSADLMIQKLSDKFSKPIYRILQAIYPTWLVSRLGQGMGVYLNLSGVKPA